MSDPLRCQRCGAGISAPCFSVGQWCWSCGEVARGSDRDGIDYMKRYYEEMRRLADQIDATRPSTDDREKLIRGLLYVGERVLAKLDEATA